LASLPCFTGGLSAETAMLLQALQQVDALAQCRIALGRLD